jgi:hypothetical protein
VNAEESEDADRPLAQIISAIPADRTYRGHGPNDANDRKRTSVGIACCGSEADFNP